MTFVTPAEGRPWIAAGGARWGFSLPWLVALREVISRIRSARAGSVTLPPQPPAAAPAEQPRATGAHGLPGAVWERLAGALEAVGAPTVPPPASPGAFPARSPRRPPSRPCVESQRPALLIPTVSVAAAGQRASACDPITALRVLLRGGTRFTGRPFPLRHELSGLSPRRCHASPADTDYRKSDGGPAEPPSPALPGAAGWPPGTAVPCGSPAVCGVRARSGLRLHPAHSAEAEGLCVLLFLPFARAPRRLGWPGPHRAPGQRRLSQDSRGPLPARAAPCRPGRSSGETAAPLVCLARGSGPHQCRPPPGTRVWVQG